MVKTINIIFKLILKLTLLSINKNVKHSRYLYYSTVDLLKIFQVIFHFLFKSTLHAIVQNIISSNL